MRSTIGIPCLLAVLCTGLCAVFAPALAQAAPVLRVQVSQRGDFLLVGNTVGFDCATGTPAPAAMNAAQVEML